jgi:cobalt-zinc-cadmium efflux system outer membrane protein
LVGLEQSRAVPDVTVIVGMKRSIELPGEQTLVALKVPLPVFNRNQGNLQEALQREEKAAAELQAARVSLSSAARQALENVGARRQEAELLRAEVLPGARSAFEAATIGFENGKFSFLEVLDAQRTLIAATSQYLNALASVHRANSELESLIGAAPAAR